MTILWQMPVKDVFINKSFSCKTIQNFQIVSCFFFCRIWIILNRIPTFSLLTLIHCFSAFSDINVCILENSEEPVNRLTMTQFAKWRIILLLTSTISILKREQENMWSVVRAGPITLNILQNTTNYPRLYNKEVEWGIKIFFYIF